jgi:hypothetical protein
MTARRRAAEQGIAILVFEGITHHWLMLEPPFYVVILSVAAVYVIACCIDGINGCGE